MSNYRHSEKDEALKFHVVPNQQYDSDLVVNNFTASQWLVQFIHEEDKFDDMFAQSSSYTAVLQRVEEQLSTEEKNQIFKYKDSWIANLPLNLL